MDQGHEGISGQPPRIAYIVRRQSAGGGAELAAGRLAVELAPDWTVHRLGGGTRFSGRMIAGAKGPSWWRALRFTRSVDAALAGRSGVILNLERGPDCHIYRAGDGVHLRWRSLRFGSSPLWASNPLHWLYPALEAKTVRSARFVATNSEMVKREMERYHPESAHKVRVVFNGFDPAVYFPDPCAVPGRAAELNLPAPCRLFLFVGSGWRRKGLVQALELLAVYNQSVRPDEPQGMLLVIGKGRPERYATVIRKLNIEGAVRFLGVQTNPRRYYQAADVFLLPTLYDPFANACLEAMACGCPVITTAFNGAAEMIDHGRTGYVLREDVRKNVPENLLDAVHWCRTASPRPEQVAKSVAGLTVEREMRAFSGLMEECLS